MSRIRQNGKVLITGASSGIGAIYADRLAHRGHDLLVVARSADRLNELSRNLKAETGREIEPIVADLRDPSDLAKLEDRLRFDPEIDMLVNNAGVGATGPLLSSDVDQMSDMITLNVSALMRLSYAAAPAFALRGHGTIINIASIVAIAPEVLNGVYGGTKAFVLAFSRSLKHEFADHGLQIQVVLPGATETNFWAAAGMPIVHLPSDIVMPAEQMVDAALSGLAKGEFVTIPSLPEVEDWENFERAREVLLPNLSRANPAARFRVATEFAD